MRGGAQPLLLLQPASHSSSTSVAAWDSLEPCGERGEGRNAGNTDEDLKEEERKNLQNIGRNIGFGGRRIYYSSNL